MASVVDRITEETGATLAPPTYAEFLYELARNNATCGTFQIPGDEKSKTLLGNIAVKDFDIFDSSNGKSLSHLQATAPVITTFLYKISIGGEIPADVRN